ncbi:MAG TPA: 6-carboxytetrahydropterin synthase QueD [Candidatus Nitrosotalea sp.]|nr:6-carboxytetrahydropterin synthase QueD [Candidatus Nitrosotalea sp.]
MSNGGWKRWARKESCSSQIRKLFKFEAAHTLPYHPGKCARMHGHSYRLEVTVQGPLQTRRPARGMVQDFDRLERVVSERVLEALDHQYLNDLIENPTVENIVLWIWKRLEKRLPLLDALVLWETATSCAILRRSDIV